MVGSVLGRGAGALIAAAGSRGLQTGGGLQSAAAPALADTVQKSTGWLARIFGQGSNRLTVPLTEPLPGVQEPTYEPPASAPTTQLTTLPSGLKIASENTPVGEAHSRLLHEHSNRSALCAACVHNTPPLPHRDLVPCQHACHALVGLDSGARPLHQLRQHL